MPELPEVETIKRNLQRSIRGFRVKSVEVLTDKMVVLGEARIPVLKKGDSKRTALFALSLKNQTVSNVERRGKFLIINFKSGAVLFIHLRMSGQLIVIPKNRLSIPIMLSMAKSALPQILPSKHTHAIFTFDNGSKLFYNDVRQFGHLRFTDKASAEMFLKTLRLGPEPLDTSLPEFKEIISAHKNRSIKAILLDQEAIAGIGNIYADESLFASRINPVRLAGTLKPKEIAELHKSLQMILKRAIELGGSSLEYYLKTNGASGSFVSEHKVYGKSGKKCPKCGTVLKSRKIAGRSTVFCPVCQR